MKNSLIKKSIRRKLLFTMMSLIIVFLIIVTLLQINSQTSLLKDELNARTQLMKKHLTSRAYKVSKYSVGYIEGEISSDSFEEIHISLTKAVKDDDELIYAILMNTSRKVTTHTLNPELEQKILNTKAALFAVQQQKFSKNEYQRNNIEILEIISPVKVSLSQWGVLRLGFSLAALEQKINQSKQKNDQRIKEMVIGSLLIACLFLIFSSTIIIVLSNKLLKPISDLTKVVNQLATGDFTAAENLNLKTHDEIEVLADTFVEMSKNLKNSYKKLENYNYDLERQVDKRTIQLAESRDQALNANDAKTQFLATVSHEIRNPMHAIINTTELILKTQLNSKQRNHLGNVLNISNKLIYLINDLLDIAKIEAGKLKIEQIPLNIREILNSISNLTLVKAEKKSIQLEFLLEDNVPLFLIGDPLRLTQILLNLVTNAIKFTNTGKVVVSIEMLAAESHNVHLKFCVADTGIGLSPEQIANLFQSFNQADGTIARKHGGTGLGLVISKQLVEMMGGSINLRSELGKGSQFYFELNLKLEPELLSQIPALPEKLKNLKILVVDDDAISRMVLQSYLESFGFKVDSVESGEHALSLLLNPPLEPHYGLVLMDWEMPELDGIETSKRIKLNHQIIPIPTIIMVTSHSRDDVLPHIHDGDIDALLIKPVEPRNLLENIARTLHVDIPDCSQQSLKIHSTNTKKITGTKILVVDDDDINRLIAKEMLEDEGLKVDLAEGGQQALEKINQHQFDIVLMDLQMPGMDGYETCREIRSNPKHKDLPIIALSAHAMSEIKDKCLQAGMNDYVSKPFKIAELIKTLIRWTQTKENTVGRSEKEKTQKINNQQLFTCLSGVDVELALERLDGKTDLFQKLLLNFLSDFGDISNKINQAFCTKDDVSAKRLVHSLKGASGNINATLLYEKSQKLELSINKKENRFQALSECDIALKQLLESIEKLPK
jgi:CheY-like chemotaxis protein/signal transduction histidine kinase/HPt (histidine-containing phosphotransfer) domain-containing protein